MQLPRLLPLTATTTDLLASKKLQQKSCLYVSLTGTTDWTVAPDSDNN